MYVNFISTSLAITAYHWAHLKNLNIWTVCDSPYYPFYLCSIIPIFNEFRANQHG